MSKCWIALLTIALGGDIGRTPAQTMPPQKAEAELRAEAARADDLLDKQNFVAALPLYEDLHAQQPQNLRFEERLAFSLLGSATQETPEKAATTHARARKLLLEAQAAGDNSNMLTVLLERTVTPAGPEPPRQPGQDLIDEGEKAFTRGHLEGALQAYSKALEVNPHLYSAALFAGDVEFKQNHPAEAGTWFARAIAIDPNIETAHRYWGDTLEKSGNHQHAEQEFIKAIVAQPYQRASRVGLQQWAMRNHAQMVAPPIKLPASAKTEVTPTPDGHTGGMNITLPAGDLGKNNPELGLEIAYQLQTAMWRGNQFHLQYPAETSYRHSLGEVMAGIRVMLAVAAEQHIPDDKLSTSTKLLRELEGKGMLECWVLLDDADQGIAQDYAAYRDTHRALLEKYIAEYDLHLS